MQSQTRRLFYRTILSTIGSIIGFGLAIPSGLYLLVNGKARQKGLFVQAAKLSELEVGKPLKVIFERTRVDGWRTSQQKDTAWVVLREINDAVAYSPQCTHLGCAYHWDMARNEFVCPCHESVFSLHGEVKKGPAPRPLDRYVTGVQGDYLMIGSEIRKSLPTR